MSSELEEDQERPLRLGGDLLEGAHRGDLLMGDRRLWLGYLTLTERLGDLDLDRRGLLPFLLHGGEVVERGQLPFRPFEVDNAFVLLLGYRRLSLNPIE